MDIFLWEWTLPPYHILSRGIHSLISRKKGQPEEGVTVTSGWNLVARDTKKGARLWTQFVKRTWWIWGFWSFLYLWDSSMTRIRRTISTFTKTMKNAAEVFPNWSLWKEWSNKIGNSWQLFMGQILHHLIGVSSLWPYVPQDWTVINIMHNLRAGHWNSPLESQDWWDPLPGNFWNLPEKWWLEWLEGKFSFLVVWLCFRGKLAVKPACVSCRVIPWHWLMPLELCHINQDDLEIFAARIVVDPRRSYKVSSYENGTLLEASEKRAKRVVDGCYWRKTWLNLGSWKVTLTLG